jgi:hypothetical protein
MPDGTELYHALVDEGFVLPDDCADVHLTMPIGGLFQLHYTVNVSGDNLIKLGRALARIGEKHVGEPAVVAGWESSGDGVEQATHVDKPTDGLNNT